MNVTARPRTLARDVRAGMGAVRLQGSVQTVRRLGGLTFVVVRDRSGTIQVVAPGPTDLPLETVVEVAGQARSDDRAPGGVEVAAGRITVLGRPAVPLPFDISKPALHASLDTLLDHRARSLRHPQVRSVFQIASALVNGFRQHFISLGFTEIHTSKLVGAATEGGANLFEVDCGDRPAFLAQPAALQTDLRGRVRTCLRGRAGVPQ